MSKNKILLTAVVCLFLANAVFAQNEKNVEFLQSYEVKMQLLSASNKANGKDEVPKNLSAIVKKLRENLSFNDYKLVETYFHRVTVPGTIDFNGISNRLISGSEENLTIFQEWSLKNMQIVKDSVGKNYIQSGAFRFSARVPVKGSEATTYSPVGFTDYNFNLPENVPTLAGSFSMPQSDEFVFVVLTVKKTDE